MTRKHGLLRSKNRNQPDAPKQGPLGGTNRKQYWGVLAPDAAGKTVRRPDNFKSMIQAHYQNAKLAGKDKPD